MKTLSLVLLLTMLATPALAHTGHGEVSGLVHGLQHPLLGIDHLLAMLAVGLWSGFVLKQRVWLGAATFMTAMTSGAALGWSGVALPMVESGILLSVIAFGVLTVAGRKGQAEGLTRASLCAIALFAVCHGQAHAVEASGNASAYLFGFLASTAALHTLGLVLARQVAGRHLVQRGIGLGIAASGLLLLVG